MTKRATTLVVVLLCLLAGCGGFDGQTAGPATEESATPAPVPAVTTETGDGEASNLSALDVAQTHRRALDDRSYTRRARVDWEGANGSRVVETTVHRVAADGNRFRATADYDAPRDADDRTGQEQWYDGNRTSVRTAFADGTVEYARIPYQPVDSYPRVRLVGALFSRLDVSSVRDAPDGSTVVTGRVDGLPRAPTLPAVFDAENASMSARITPAGHVDRVALGFDATPDDRPVHVRFTVEYVDVGSTTVEEPAWVGNVTENGTA